MVGSICSAGSTSLDFSAGNDVFRASGRGSLYDKLEGIEKDGAKLCPFSHNNALLIRKFFPYAAPMRNTKYSVSIGLGDRLGIAGVGQLRAIEGRNVFPVLAQQSMRELKLTNRSYEEVLDAATWAVIKSGYKGGYGADGDHLKELKDIEYALACGYSMITLDCSEHIHGSVLSWSDSEVENAYERHTAEYAYIMKKYLNKTIELAGYNFLIDKMAIMRFCLVYGETIIFIRRVWSKYIKAANVDFEISIDETDVSTDPLSHYILGSELISEGIGLTSMAPRFCGHFEKGIDYVGDIKQFAHEFKIHEAICKKLGYKISVHSGSDKFSVFPIIGEFADEFHLKTAGTSWLEAVRAIAKANPALMRGLYKYAIEVNEKAKQFYVITSGVDTLPDIDKIEDDDLPSLLDRDDVRQTMHIAYGYILCDKKDGRYIFRDELYKTLEDNAQVYSDMLKAHFDKHLSLLGR